MFVQLDYKTTGTYFTPMFMIKHCCHTTLHRTYYSSTYYSTAHNKNNMALHNLQVQPLQYAISNTAQSKCQEYCKMSDLHTLAGQVHVCIYIKAAVTSELSS